MRRGGGLRLLVTGGSSFVGAWFCLRAARRHTVFALHHSTPLQLNGVTPVRADLRTARSLERLAAVQADAVVHLACKIKAQQRGEQTGAQVAAETNRQLMQTVLALGLPTVYASSTVVHWDQETPYGQSRRDDEARLRESGLPFAILRPSAPYGPRLAGHRPRHTESFHTLARLVRTLPVVPILGDGRYRRQPVHVVDFADAALALLEQGLPDQAFEAGGGEALSMDEIVQRVARAAGRSGRHVHLPKSLFVQLGRLSADFDPDLLAAADQDELACPAALEAASGVRMRPFSEGVADLLR